MRHKRRRDRQTDYSERLALKNCNGPYSYGLYSYGPYSYGLYSYGSYSYGPAEHPEGPKNEKLSALAD